MDKLLTKPWFQERPCPSRRQEAQVLGETGSTSRDGRALDVPTGAGERRSTAWQGVPGCYMSDKDTQPCCPTGDAARNSTRSQREDPRRRRPTRGRTIFSACSLWRSLNRTQTPRIVTSSFSTNQICRIWSPRHQKVQKGGFAGGRSEVGIPEDSWRHGITATVTHRK